LPASPGRLAQDSLSGISGGYPVVQILDTEFPSKAGFLAAEPSPPEVLGVAQPAIFEE
jgi:hypothetical protein